jgi:hypothetical protein
MTHPITDPRIILAIAAFGLTALLYGLVKLVRWLDAHYNQGYDPSAERRARSSAIVDPDPLYDEPTIAAPYCFDCMNGYAHQRKAGCWNTGALLRFPQPGPPC